jgi:hypothetical protein
MAGKAGWKHLKKGEKCTLCGHVTSKLSFACSYSTQNPNFFYCWHNRKSFFVDKRGKIIFKETPKWEEKLCLLCGGFCVSLIENSKQRWCRTKKITYFVRSNGELVCPSSK